MRATGPFRPQASRPAPRVWSRTHVLAVALFVVAVVALAVSSGGSPGKAGAIPSGGTPTSGSAVRSRGAGSPSGAIRPGVDATGAPTEPSAASTSPAGGTLPAASTAPTSDGSPVPTGSGAPSSAPGSSAVPAAAPPRPIATGPFAGGLLIADRGNNRLLIVSNSGRIVWRFPVAGSLPKGQGFSADDAFISPDGRSISANEEQRQVVVRIDIASRRIVWEYGHYYGVGSGAGYLNTPDDAYPLANGDVVIADIFNCRVIEVSPAKKIVRQWGHTGVCRDRPPFDYNQPNGDTPLPDGGLLITEIVGSRVVRLDAAGRVVFDIRVPAIYPSDAQLDPQGNVVVADYSNPGAVMAVTPNGRLLWRYGPRTGAGRLDHPSLAVPRPDGTIVLNDDFRHRVMVIDPRTGRILWQYGLTGVRGTGPNHLYIPDGIDELPAGAVPGL